MQCATRCEKAGIPYSYVEKDFADKEAAKQWMLQEQAGRRNLNDDQRAAAA